MLRNAFSILALVGSMAAVAAADEPSVSYIFPAGGQRGTTVNFRVGGHYLHESCPFEMLGPGIRANDRLQRAEQTTWFEGPVIPLPDSQRKEDYPTDYLGSVAIDGEAPLGFRRWRVWTSQGATATLPFVVGDLPEIIEREREGAPIPTRVQPPVTINGRIFPREDVDIWAFDAKAGETYTCEVLAARIGSPLDSRLVVYGPNGDKLVENVDALGDDSRLSFQATEDGEYQVHIHDADFGGLQHYVYRLTITGQPFVEHTYPLGGRRGETVPIELLGQNLPSEPISLSLGQQFQHIAAVAHASRVLAFSDALPRSNPFCLELSDLPELLEREPNDSPRQATEFTTPVVLNGRIQQPGDVDLWRFHAEKDSRFDFELRAAQLGSPLVSALTVRDEAGRVLAESNLANNQIDAHLTFQSPHEGHFTLAVSDRFASRGGPAFAYRLYAQRQEDLAPSFELRLPTDALTLLRGREAKLKVTAERSGGFTGPIQIHIEGLPSGVTADDVEIGDKKSDATLVFQASAEARVDVHRLTIRGHATVGSDPDSITIERVAAPARTSPWDVESDHLLLAVAMPTPFKIVGDFETKYADRGSTYVRQYAIARGGYEGPLAVRLADRQVRHLQGVTGPSITVPAGVDRFDYPVHLPPWMEIGRTSRTCLMAVGEVLDAEGRKHTVSSTSHEQNDQIIVLVDPGQLGLRLDRSSLLARRGTRATVGVHVGRGQSLTGPVRVELICPEHIRGIECEPLELSANESQGLLRLSFASDALGPLNMPLVIRATTTRDGHPYTAETMLELVE